MYFEVECVAKKYCVINDYKDDQFANRVQYVYSCIHYRHQRNLVQISILSVKNARHGSKMATEPHRYRSGQFPGKNTGNM